MQLLTVTKHHPTYTEVKQLVILYNFKWWNGNTYLNFRVFTNYILNN